MSSFFNYLSTIFPSYVPQYGNLPQYTFWSTSFLMYFMIFITTGALAFVTIMDKDGKSAPSSNLGPAPPVPSAPSAPKVPSIGGKKRKTYKHK